MKELIIDKETKKIIELSEISDSSIKENIVFEYPNDISNFKFLDGIYLYDTLNSYKKIEQNIPYNILHEEIYEPPFMNMPINYRGYNNQENLLFSIELQVDSLQEKNLQPILNQLLDISGDIYFKKDTTLRNGFKLITYPATLQYHQNNMNWDKICEILIQNGLLSKHTFNCGIKYKILRNSIGSTIKYTNLIGAKVFFFCLLHRDKMIEISGRTEPQLSQCQFLNMDFDAYISNTQILNAIIELQTKIRNCAVDMTKENTIDFCLFNGTLNYKELLDRLTFVDNLFKYAMEHDMEEIKKSDTLN